ncbi:hypothetical protein [Serratia sp. Se-RSBMAAmG]|uniref:hypothetical protein n=1 Tax=Serratia sp. Se-RSBMAAmG TaxID=3043305 RepID=UPI0024AEF1AE|nr:hypothetical protein [Serratia sp. Se-RSBMAAmG]MDI6977275.1 hypothetical protein [Serratia sp. Se-RSBMAAmG]
MYTKEERLAFLNDAQKTALIEKKAWLEKLAGGTKVERDISMLLLSSAKSFKSMNDNSIRVTFQDMGLGYFYGLELQDLLSEYGLPDSKERNIDGYPAIIEYIGSKPDTQMTEVLYMILSHLRLCVNFAERSDSKEDSEMLAPAKAMFEQVKSIIGSEKIDVNYLTN